MTETNPYADIRSAVKPFEQPVLAISLYQAVSSIALFIGACALMYWSLQFSYALTLLLAIPTGALLVRVFILQHDCGHGSFFAQRWANDSLGALCSVLTLTPYANWKRQHAVHHATWNNLDKRNTGADIYSTCLTVAEYKALTAWQRCFYRVPRSFFVAHLLIPPLVFLVLYRMPFDTPRAWSRERRSVHLTNLALVLLIGGLVWMLGIVPVLAVQLPVIVVTSIVGVWLFAVQHRFEGAYWARQPGWTFGKAALQGSSYLKLPKPLQWFTGNIGFHHVHHFAPRVPNYRLESCHSTTSALQYETPMTIGTAMKALGLALWDEDAKRFVRFRDVAAA